jgi:hypothetical protein
MTEIRLMRRFICRISASWMQSKNSRLNIGLSWNSPTNSYWFSPITLFVGYRTLTESTSCLRREQEKSRSARKILKTEIRKLHKHPLRQSSSTSLSNRKSSYLNPLAPHRKSSLLTAPHSAHGWMTSSKSRKTPSFWSTTSRSPAISFSRLSPT